MPNAQFSGPRTHRDHPRTDEGRAWTLFVALALYALAFLSLLSVGILVHDSGANASTLVWFVLPAVLLPAAARMLSSASRPRRKTASRSGRRTPHVNDTS